ncbi:hypothetical protein [Spongiimicrobium sp. 2-473A-2-J]|uniref:hypothetical protein n=1 Tax=Eudoraea algarum TaxID=3417568 RepID=UPI003D36F004
MRLNKKLVLIFIILILSSCTDKNEDLPVDFTLVVENRSDSTLTMSLFYNNLGTREFFQEVRLEASESYRCKYKQEVFTGLHGCLDSNTRGIDSVSLVFSDNKGYICVDKLLSDQELCFKDKYLFGGPDSFESLGDNTFRVSITQEDFENALELPE